MYPPPPWHTHGRAWVQPYLVDATTVTLPPGFRAVSVLGKAVGFLALIEYVPPSPLVYAELTWLPCLVDAAGRRGLYIAKMYVDSRDSLAGGREIWAIPKQLARFDIRNEAATIDTEDGAHVELGLHRRGPAVRLKAGAGTLQPRDGGIVAFRGSGTAATASGGLKVTASRGMDAWLGWPGATRLPGLGAALTRFEITMHPPG
jgi:hypothetical protein